MTDELHSSVTIKAIPEYRWLITGINSNGDEVFRAVEELLDEALDAAKEACKKVKCPQKYIKIDIRERLNADGPDA